MNKEIKEYFNKQAEKWDGREEKDQKWYQSFISTYVPVKEKMDVLDIGCGTGVISNVLYEITKKQITAIDIADEMIKIAKTKFPESHVKFICTDLFSIDNKKFDMLICHNAYPHFINPNKFADKTYELLNDNGLLVIIHSISKNAINNHHFSLSKDLARDIKSPLDEFEYFKDKFRLIRTIDNDNMYLMILEKNGN